MTLFNEANYGCIEQDFDTEFLKNLDEVCERELQDLEIVKFVTPLNILEESNEKVKEKMKDYQNQHEEMKNKRDALIDFRNLTDKGCKDKLESIIHSQSLIDDEIIVLKENLNSKKEILTALQNCVPEGIGNIDFDPNIRLQLQAMKSFFPVILEEFKEGSVHGYILNRDKHEVEKCSLEADSRYSVSNDIWNMLGESSFYEKF